MNQIIDTLQRIEAGLLDELTSDLQDLIGSVKMHKGIPAKEECPICHADVIVEHHIKSYTEPRDYNGDERNYVGYIGIIWICPNCHHKVHNRNPYFLKH